MPKKEKPEKSGKTEKKEEPKKISQAQFEEKVIELAKSGLTSEKVGETLRRQGIHPQEYNKKISKILKEKEMYINPELKNTEAKFQKIKKHAEKHKQDKKAAREQSRMLSQIRKIKEYHKLI